MPETALRCQSKSLQESKATEPPNRPGKALGWLRFAQLHSCSLCLATNTSGEETEGTQQLWQVVLWEMCIPQSACACGTVSEELPGTEPWCF